MCGDGRWQMAAGYGAAEAGRPARLQCRRVKYLVGHGGDLARHLPWAAQHALRLRAHGRQREGRVLVARRRLRAVAEQVALRALRRRVLVWSSRALRVVSQQLGAQQHRVRVQVVVLATLLRRVPLLGRRVWQQRKAVLQVDAPPARDEAVAVDAWAPHAALAAVRGRQRSAAAGQPGV